MTLSLSPMTGTNGAARQIGSGSLLIGRDPRAQIRLEDATASGRHCVISGQGGEWQIQDFSRNGTFVNGEKLTAKRRLVSGDRVRIAQSEWQVSIDGAAQEGDATYVRAVTPPEEPIEHTRTMSSSARKAATAEDSGDSRFLGPALEVIAALARTRKQARTDLLGVTPGKTTTDAREKAPLADCRKGQALATLASLSSAEAEQVIRDTGRNLAAHDAALLAAMQGALHTVLDQFAPDEIQRGGKNDAQAWQAYRAAFEDDDLGFVELFARSFEEAYRKQIGQSEK